MFESPLNTDPDPNLPVGWGLSSAGMALDTGMCETTTASSRKAHFMPGSLFYVLMQHQ